MKTIILKLIKLQTVLKILVLLNIIIFLNHIKLGKNVLMVVYIVMNLVQVFMIQNVKKIFAQKATIPL